MISYTLKQFITQVGMVCIASGCGNDGLDDESANPDDQPGMVNTAVVHTFDDSRSLRWAAAKQLSFVGHILVEGREFTGILITPSTVLTNAYSFAGLIDQTSSNGKTKPVRWTFNMTADANEPTSESMIVLSELRKDQTRNHDTWRYESTGNRDGTNLAILKLARPISPEVATPAVLLDGSSAAYDECFIAGYGRSGSHESGPNVYDRKRRIAIADLFRDWEGLIVRDHKERTSGKTFSANGHSRWFGVPADGDIGGPLLTGKLPNDLIVIGIFHSNNIASINTETTNVTVHGPRVFLA